MQTEERLIASAQVTHNESAHEGYCAIFYVQYCGE